MALYMYEAFSQDGKRVRGQLDAPSVGSVKEQLSRQGLFPTSIVPAYEVQEGLLTRIFSRGVTTKNKILFTKQLMVLLKSGVPLLQAFELLVDQFEGKLHTILISVKDSIKEGSSLADALKRYPRVFETIYVQLVRAGEASGNLEIILQRLSEYLERREEIRAEVQGALRQPMIQLIVAGIVVSGLLVYIVPQMAESFLSQGATLPLPTTMLLAISDFITGHYLILILSITALVGLYGYWKSTPQGARILDIIKLRLPLVKYLAKTNAVVQFSYTLGMLLEGGVHLSEALDVVVQIIDNQILSNVLQKARDKIVKEGKIAQYLKQTDIFPSIAIYLIETGEKSGELGKMLLTVAQNYEKELREQIDQLTAIIGPIMLVFVAVVVGFIVLSIILPIMRMGELAGI